MNEAGRTTQPSYISAPPGLEADPDGEAADTVSDNDSMSSRNRTGSSRSGAARRAGGAKGASTETADKGQDVTASDNATPLPSEAVAQASGSSRSAAETSGPAESARGDAAASDRQPVFTPATPDATRKPASPAPASSGTEPTSVNPATRPGPSYPPSSYSGSGSYPGSSYSGSSSYAPSGQSSAYPGSPGYRPAGRANGAGPATATTAAPGAAAESGSSGGAFSSVNGFSTGAASAVTGAASGFASSVASVFKRGQKGDGSSRTQVRRPARRQAMLTLSRLEPWSVMKFSFVASVVAFVILFVAVAVLYMVLSALGVFDSLQNTVSSITSSKSNAGTNISHWFSPSLILGYTAMLGALNIVLITAMSTVGSVIYNLIAKTVGGVEVTLRETD